MARKPRVHVPGAFHHVMVRGNNKAQIFFNDTDRNLFINLLKKATNRFQSRVHAYCLMTNHAHLIIQVGEIPLSKIMHDVGFKYATWINESNDRCGHVFQGRYNEKIVKHDEYLMTLLRYIHLNPLEAKIASSLDEYPWSSHSIYSGLNKQNWVTTDYILSLFSINRRNAISTYIKFMTDEALKMQTNCSPFELIDEDTFIQNLEKKTSLNLWYQKIDDIADLVCNHFSVDKSLLKNKPVTKTSQDINVIIIILAKEIAFVRLSDLANYFSREVSTISRALNKHENDTLIQSAVKKLKILVDKKYS